MCSSIYDCLPRPGDVTGDPAQQPLGGQLPDPGRILGDGGQRHRKQVAVGHVVEGDQRYLTVFTQIVQGAHRADGQMVLGRE